MFKKNEKPNHNMNLVDYAILVERIVGHYFDEEGTYQPHYGKFNLMADYYNMVFKKPDEKQVEEVDEINALTKNGEFMTSFSLVLSGCFGSESDTVFDFYHAYVDAMDIVDTKKSGIGQIDRLIHVAREEFGQVLSKENIEKFAVMSQAIQDGNLNTNQILLDYIKSDEGQKKIVDIAKRARKDGK